MPEIVLWHWFAFGGLVVVLLTLDLCVFHRTDHEPSLKESAWWTVFWIGLALVFNALIWWWGRVEGRPHMGIEFLNGYLIEKSLSMDNIFVFVVIFRFFNVPLMYQYRVLFWGILGAIIMRLIFIVAGATVIHYFEPIFVVFGLFLVYTAYKLAMHSGEDVHPENNMVLRTARKYFRVTKGDHHEHGHKFFVREGGQLAVNADVPGAVGRRKHRCCFRRGQHSRGLRSDARSVYRFHVKHFCDPGVASPLFPPGRDHRPLPLFALRPCGGPGVCGREDGYRVLASTYDSPCRVALRHRFFAYHLDCGFDHCRAEREAIAT